MINFTTTIKKFAKQGEKTGWTYVEIPAAIAQELKRGNKQSFRVKGKLDDYKISGMALIPMGGGNFILPLNAAVRKSIKKAKGDQLKLMLKEDKTPVQPPAELIDCLSDEPEAFENYRKLPQSHQNYFTRWIESAKTDATKAKRIAAAVNALLKGVDFGTMVRNMKSERQDILKDQ